MNPFEISDTIFIISQKTVDEDEDDEDDDEKSSKKGNNTSKQSAKKKSTTGAKKSLTATENDSLKKEFDAFPKDSLLRSLKSLTHTDTMDGKLFYSSYSDKWKDLSEKQQEKAFLFFATKINNETRDLVRQKILSNNEQDEKEKSVRTQMVHSDDLIRLLHLRQDPALASLWTAALSPKDRPTLDKQKSGDVSDPYEDLASSFNDESNIYTNMCYTMDSEKKRMPLKPELSLLCETIKDIQPNPVGRPPRTGAWIREKWTSLKAELTILSNLFYHRSGQHDGENNFDAWVKLVNKQPSQGPVHYYAIVIMEKYDFLQLGKLAPNSEHYDTAQLRDMTEEERLSQLDAIQDTQRKARNAERRRKQRKAKKLRTQRSDSVASGVKASADKSLPEEIGQHLGKHRKIERKRLSLDEMESKERMRIQRIEAEERIELNVIREGMSIGDASEKSLARDLLKQKLELVKKSMSEKEDKKSDSFLPRVLYREESSSVRYDSEQYSSSSEDEVQYLKSTKQIRTTKRSDNDSFSEDDDSDDSISQKKETGDMNLKTSDPLESSDTDESYMEMMGTN